MGRYYLNGLQENRMGGREADSSVSGLEKLADCYGHSNETSVP
jgi:hypothetical protein